MRDKILEILCSACGNDIVKKDTSINLYDNMLMDSLALIELTEGLEDELGIVLQPTQLSREDLETPENIIRAVERAL